MGENTQRMVHIPQAPAVVDTISLRNVQLHLPSAPEPWGRLCQRQPCSVSIRLSYSSAAVAAAADDVSLTLDYGKLYRRIYEEIGSPTATATSGGLMTPNGQVLKVICDEDPRQDIRFTAGIISRCAFDLLVEAAEENRENAPGAIEDSFGQCEVLMHLPNALLRADDGIHYRAMTTMGEGQGEGRVTVLLSEEFHIRRIRSYAILGINPHERLAKQAVIISLTFKTTGDVAHQSQIRETYPEMTRCIAETIDSTAFQSVEALATLVARLVVVDFSNDEVTVLVEKPSAVAFAEGTGIEITRSRAFFM